MSDRRNSNRSGRHGLHFYMIVSMVLGLVTSTELISRITQDLDKGKLPISIFLDLSKAFDAIDHVILLQKLNYYGIKSIELKLFKDYLQIEANIYCL